MDPFSLQHTPDQAQMQIFEVKAAKIPWRKNNFWRQMLATAKWSPHSDSPFPGLLSYSDKNKKTPRNKLKAR